MNRDEWGFTIIELLFIILVISIIVTFVYPLFNDIIERAYDVNLKKTIGSFRNLMSMYCQDNNKYPDGSYSFYELKDNVLIEYGHLGNINDVIESQNYKSSNDESKTYELKLVSSKTKKIYIIDQDGVYITE